MQKEQVIRTPKTFLKVKFFNSKVKRKFKENSKEKSEY